MMLDLQLRRAFLRELVKKARRLIDTIYSIFIKTAITKVYLHERNVYVTLPRFLTLIYM